MFASILLTLIFTALSTLHWYWVATGTAALNDFVPETDGQPAFQPSRFITAIIATLLLTAAALCASQAELFGLPRFPLTTIGVWVLLTLFALRAIGEFNLVGFFKRVRDTRFGQRDTWLYSPLCLLISLLCALLLYST